MATTTNYDAAIDYDAIIDFDGVIGTPPVPDGGPNIYQRYYMFNIGRGMMGSLVFLATLFRL